MLTNTMEEIRLNPMSLRFHANPTFEMVKAAVERDGCAVQHVDLSNFTSEESRQLAHIALHQDIESIQYIPFTAIGAEMLIQIARQHGYVFLRHVDPILRKIPGMVQLAVESDPWAIQFASKELQSDPSIYHPALISDISIRSLFKDTPVPEHVTRQAFFNSKLKDALRYVPEDQRAYDMCRHAVKNYWGALKYVPQQDRDLCLMATDQNWKALKYVDHSKLTTDDMESIVQRSWEAMKYVPKAYQTQSMVAAALDQSCNVFEYVKIRVKDDLYIRALQQGAKRKWLPYACGNIPFHIKAFACGLDMGENANSLRAHAFVRSLNVDTDDYRSERFISALESYVNELPREKERQLNTWVRFKLLLDYLKTPVAVEVPKPTYVSHMKKRKVSSIRHLKGTQHHQHPDGWINFWKAHCKDRPTMCPCVQTTNYRDPSKTQPHALEWDTPGAIVGAHVEVVTKKGPVWMIVPTCASCNGAANSHEDRCTFISDPVGVTFYQKGSFCGHIKVGTSTGPIRIQQHGEGLRLTTGKDVLDIDKSNTFMKRLAVESLYNHADAFTPQVMQAKRRRLMNV